MPAIADIADYADADRAERLVAGACLQDALTLYSSAPVEVTAALAAAFEKAYGIKVRLWRGCDRDRWSRAGSADARTVAVRRHCPMRADRAFAATRYSVFAIAYNTPLVGAAEVPQRHEDLLDAKWKGRLRCRLVAGFAIRLGGGRNAAGRPRASGCSEVTSAKFRHGLGPVRP